MQLISIFCLREILILSCCCVQYLGFVVDIHKNFIGAISVKKNYEISTGAWDRTIMPQINNLISFLATPFLLSGSLLLFYPDNNHTFTKSLHFSDNPFID